MYTNITFSPVAYTFHPSCYNTLLCYFCCFIIYYRKCEDECRFKLLQAVFLECRSFDVFCDMITGGELEESWCLSFLIKQTVITDINRSDEKGDFT